MKNKQVKQMIESLCRGNTRYGHHIYYKNDCEGYVKEKGTYGLRHYNKVVSLSKEVVLAKQEVVGEDSEGLLIKSPFSSNSFFTSEGLVCKVTTYNSL